MNNLLAFLTTTQSEIYFAAFVKKVDMEKMVEVAEKSARLNNFRPVNFFSLGSSIEVHPDFSGIELNAQLIKEYFLSMGYSTFNICKTANELGYEADPVVLKDETGRDFVKISFSSSKHGNKLFFKLSEIKHNRIVNRDIPKEIISLLRYNTSGDSIRSRFYDRESAGFFILRDMVKTEKKFGFLDAILFNSRRKNPVIRKIDSSSHLVLFTIRKDDAENWISLGRSLQQFRLETESYGVNVDHVLDFNEIDRLSLQIRNNFSLFNEMPVLLVSLT